jgi:SAM-dependent methyltransferase
MSHIMDDRMKKAEMLKRHIQELAKRHSLTPMAGFPDIITCDAVGLDGKDHRQECVRAFYEKMPYHKNPPRHSLEARLVQLQDDWAQWCIPVSMENRRTLDAGCGCGYNLVLHGALSALTVGVDISLEALKKANSYIIENSVKNNITLIRSDIRELTLPDASFDVITCVGVLHHIPDHKGALEKLAQLLDREGLLLLGIYHPLGRASHRLKNRFLDILAGKTAAKRVRWATRLFPVAKEADKYDIPLEIYLRDAYATPHENAFSVRYLSRLAKNMGLRLIEVRPSPSMGFSGSIKDKANILSNGGKPLDAAALDRALAKMRQHHYWCLLKKVSM